ncbi:MAG: AMP-binding protein [Clostridiales bacterium]|nr:AMP-binding protein [Clostridiales bacterium]
MAKPFYHTRMNADTIQSLIENVVEKYSNNAYCIYVAEGETVTKTYGEMMSNIERIETYLFDSGVKHVGLLGATSYHWLCVFMACLHAGVVIVPLDALLPDDDLIFQIEHADIEILFCDEKFQSLSEKINKDGKCKSFCYLDQDGEGSLSFAMNKQASRPHISPPVLDKQDFAMIVYTSGATGEPKGVMLSQENLVAASHYGAAVVDTPIGARLLVLLPNNHMFTIGHCFLTPLFFGAGLFLNDSIYNTFNNIKKHKIDFIVAVPAVIRLFKNEIDIQLKKAGFGPIESMDKIRRALVTTAIRKKIGSNLQSIVCGGAPLDQMYVHFFKLLGIQLQGGYGMTECAPLISCQVKNHLDYSRADSVGRPGVCCQAKIVDGEIWVSGINVMLGYYKDPDATSATLLDGWLRTGDLGRLDEEGFLYVTGRIKNLMILSNGENVSPEELEMLFDKCRYVDGVIVSANDDLDIIAAEVYPAQAAVEEMGLEKIQSLIREEVKDINQNLPIYKQIKLVTFRDQPFERTTTLKIKR